MKSPDVIVMKSVASDRRYLAENLAILDPNQTRAGVRYRSVWLAPDLRKHPGTLRGRVGLVVFFDWETGLFEAVREVEIGDVAESGEFVRLALGCGRFVRVSEPLTRDHIPRLSDEGFNDRVPEPADRKGRHSFVYAVPPEWKRQIESLTSREDAASWFELLRSLVAPKGSPYRSCRIVFLSSGEERKELTLSARTPLWRKPGQLPVRVYAIDGSQPASGTVPVRILGYVGQRTYWSTEVSVSPAEPGRVLVPRPDPDTFGGSPTVRLEAFPLGYGSTTGSLVTTDSVSALEMLLEVGGGPDLEASAPVESWTRALEHVDPGSDERKRPMNPVLPGPGVIADSSRYGEADGQARFEAAGDGEAGGAVASQRRIGGLVREGSGNPGIPAVVLGPAVGGERSGDVRPGARDFGGERGDERELRALPRRRPTPRDPAGTDGPSAAAAALGPSGVLTLPPSVRVSLATGATDMRRSVDGLRALVLRHGLGDPYSGHLFVFRNRRGDRLKILVWDRSGFWVLYKRLEKGTFAWPEASETGAMSIHAGDLALLLSGVDPARTKRRSWYERAA